MSTLLSRLKDFKVVLETTMQEKSHSQEYKKSLQMCHDTLFPDQSGIGYGWISSESGKRLKKSLLKNQQWIEGYSENIHLTEDGRSACQFVLQKLQEVLTGGGAFV